MVRLFILETYRRRRVDKLVNDIVISGSRYYTPSQLYQYGVLDVKDLRRERIFLARMLKFERDEEKRREIYRRINRAKLHELILSVYYLIDLERYDRDRMYYTMLYNVAKELVGKVDLCKDGVKEERNSLEYLSDDAAVFLYITYFAVLYNFRLQALLDRVREIVFHIIRSRKNRKIEKLHRIICEKYGDVIAKVVFRL